MTNSLTHLSKLDLIVTMRQGKISEVGTYDELISSEGAFADFVKMYLEEMDDDDDSDEAGKRWRIFKYVAESFGYTASVAK